MADYIYLLENRLSPAQRAALRSLREIARARNLTIFLVGGAVRDLTSGSPVRDLDVVVQGNATKLRKEIEKAGGVITGESEGTQALFVNFPGNSRVEVGSTLSVAYPKPGKAVTKPATILDDLRRRDFTVNAMALSLNDGSYGLLMDPLNGVADIENRQLRLVSNYGFIEEPVRMIRASRLGARLGWTMDEKTQARYETGRQESYIGAMSEFHRGYESEEIVHEEDPLRVLKRLEAEGWMKFLAPYWTSAKANVAELERLRETQSQLQMQGIHPDTSAANFPLLTAKLSSKEIASLKQSFPRQGFVEEIERLEADAKEFAGQLTAKASALPSQAWRLITSAKPEAVLWVAFSTKNSALQAKFKSFSTEWPLARQKMPYVMMQEMRIVPELAGYDALLERLFFELMDNNLQTPEEMKAFLEPFSPPAPPPPVNLRRPRAAKKEAKPAKSRAKKTDTTVLAAADDSLTVPVTTASSGAEVSHSGAKAVGTPRVGAETKSKAAKPAAVAAKTPAKTVVAKPAGKSTPPPSKPSSLKRAVVEKKASKPAKTVAKAKSRLLPTKTPVKKPAVAAKKPVKSVAKKTVKVVTKKAVVKKAGAKPSKGAAKKNAAAAKVKPAAKKQVAKVAAKAVKTMKKAAPVAKKTLTKAAPAAAKKAAAKKKR